MILYLTAVLSESICHLRDAGGAFILPLAEITPNQVQVRINEPPILICSICPHCKATRTKNTLVGPSVIPGTQSPYCYFSKTTVNVHCVWLVLGGDLYPSGRIDYKVVLDISVYGALHEVILTRDPICSTGIQNA